MARPGKSIAKQSEGRAGEKYLPVGWRVRTLRAVGDSSGPSEGNVDEQAWKDHRWSITAALLLELFEQPAGSAGVVPDFFLLIGRPG